MILVNGGWPCFKVKKMLSLRARLADPVYFGPDLDQTIEDKPEPETKSDPLTQPDPIKYSNQF